MKQLNRRSPTPLWAQLAEDLEARLGAGEFDERFPTDDELTRGYEVSRQTAREAVRRLRDAGMVDRQRGKGSFVSRTAWLEQPTGGFYSLARSIAASGMDERSEVLRLETLVDKEAAAQLNLAGATELVFVERLRFAGDEPLALDRSWFDSSAAGGFTRGDLASGSVYELIQRGSGIRVTGGRERIRAHIADRATATLLRLPDTEAVLVVERVAFAGSRPVEWRVSSYRGDRFAFTADWTKALHFGS